MSGTLVRYDAMCTAIAQAYEVDEVKDIRDKALALEMYAQQSNNTEAERQACEIRLRAERRAGRLIEEREAAKGGRPSINPSPTGSGLQPSKTLAELGISHNQSSRWQKLAKVPDDEFEATFADPNKKPSTRGIIAAHKPQAPIVVDVEIEKPVPPHPDALWLWGRLLDFERDGLLAKDPNVLVGTMLDHMKTTTLELAPLVAAWLGKINQ